MDKRIGLLLLLLLCVTFLPWLGDTLFNTKGEPREALVALSMLQSGNFILPESYGADIPYKPPFFAWLIAGFSILNGGEVSEATSRLPSALASIMMVMWGYCFILRRTGSPRQAFAMGVITFTTVEVFRAATACRVDMVLTACMVTAIYAIASKRLNRGAPAFSWTAVLLMTAAVLTKGPVGAMLSCLVMWVWMLIMGDNFWRATRVLALMCLCSFVVPLLWYYAAWQQGGERFLNLAIEENFGRLTGTMSYDSHVNPWWYNLLTLSAGLLPYTLLALFALTASLSKSKIGVPHVKALWPHIRSLRPETLLALTASVVIFMFYCIPSSKRSVYLLPMYPFMAYFIAMLMHRIETRALVIYAVIIAVTGLVAAWAVWGMHMLDCPTLIGNLKGEVLDLAAGLYAMKFGIVNWIAVILCILTCAATLCMINRGASDIMRNMLAATVTIYWLLATTVLPTVLNAKSDKALVAQIERVNPEHLPLYSYNYVKMMRWFTVDFYMHDTVRLFEPEEDSSQSIGSVAPTTPLPEKGLLLVSDRELPYWLERHGAAYSVDTLYHGTRRSGDCRATPLILKFATK